jgi:hypothetical protein
VLGVTWQEELRRLDEDLASGRLAADDYRARRDQVLSAAVTPSAPQPAQDSAESSQANETQIIRPVTPPQGSAPQDNSPQGSNPPQPSAEATQIVSAADVGAERTQAVSNWQTQQPSPAGGFQQPQSPPGGFQQPQYNPGPASPAGGFQQQYQQQPAWNAPQEDVSPPWGGSDLPPITPARNSDWVAQGPEAFETKQSSGKGRKIALSVLGVVVLAGLGFGVWALFINNPGPDNPVAQPTQTAPVAPTSTPKPLPQPPAIKPEPADNATALVTPPGTVRDGGGSFDLTKLKSSKLLPDSVVSALDQGSMTSGLLKASTDGSTTIGLYALSLPSSQSASTVAQAYATTQQTGGLPASRDLSMQGVPVYATTSGAGVFRAVYVLYNRVVIVEAFGSNRAAAQADFKTLLAQQVTNAPPTQRGN